MIEAAAAARSGLVLQTVQAVGKEPLAPVTDPVLVNPDLKTDLAQRPAVRTQQDQTGPTHLPRRLRVSPNSPFELHPILFRQRQPLDPEPHSDLLKR